MSKSTHDAVVADIGETHMRFAVANSDKLSIDHYVQFVNYAFASVAQALTAYLKSIPSSPPALAIAITNGAPTLSAELERTLIATRIKSDVTPRVTIVDPLDALSLALPDLGPHDIERIGGENADVGAPKAVISVGNALGVATASQANGAWAAFHGHAGNISFAPQTQEELDILKRIRGNTDYVSVEHLLSAPGLSHLYELLLEISGQIARSIPATEIVDAAGEGDTIAADALNHFTTWLGRFASDVALIYDARGGIYLWGAHPAENGKCAQARSLPRRLRRQRKTLTLAGGDTGFPHSQRRRHITGRSDGALPAERLRCATYRFTIRELVRASTLQRRFFHTTSGTSCAAGTLWPKLSTRLPAGERTALAQEVAEERRNHQRDDAGFAGLRHSGVHGHLHRYRDR
ncbi:glucokinase [Sinorhizobium fredii]|uniref:glucokinase n=1 Tax=Rhizobium fredii TaxID=380 RepID=UPI0002EFA02C